MFVPIHRGRRAAAGRSAQVKVKPAVVLAAVTTAVAGMVSSLVHAGTSGGGAGVVVVVGLAIGIGAAALGLALARAIGRQGKI